MNRARPLVALCAALAAAGVWSLLHELTNMAVQRVGHDSFAGLLEPEHLALEVAPLVPMLLLFGAAMYARRARRVVLPRVRAIDVVCGVGVLELVELGAGTMAHGWLVTVLMVAGAFVVAWLLAALAVTVVRVVAGRARDLVVPRSSDRGVGSRVHASVDVLHPSRIWLARRARRGPPLLAAAR